MWRAVHKALAGVHGNMNGCQTDGPALSTSWKVWRATNSLYEPTSILRSGMEGDIVRIAPNEVRVLLTFADVPNLTIMSQVPFSNPSVHKEI